MRIDLESWCADLNAYYANNKSVTVTDNPHGFFDCFFCEAGFPMSPDIYPIWLDEGIVISYEPNATYRFDLQTLQWREVEFDYGSADYPLFWISNAGVLGEVSSKNGKITEFFTVRSPGEVVDYLSLFKDRRLAKPLYENAPKVMPASIVRSVYAPFFRFPDDLSDNLEELPWVKVHLIYDIIQQHFKNSVPWMSLPLQQIRRRKILEEIKNQPPNSHRIDVTENGITETLTAAELLLAAFDKEGKKQSDLRSKCFEVASTLTEEDCLVGTKSLGMLRTKLWYAFFGGFSYLNLDLGIDFFPTVFAPFFLSEVNPQGFKALTDYAFVKVTEDFKPSGTAAISLPSLFHQKRIAFECLSLAHSAKIKSKQLDNFTHLATILPDALGQRALWGTRHEEIDHILQRLPTPDNELRRAINPLPYFLEAPLLDWERAPAELKVLTGLTAFGNVIRILALLGMADIRLGGELPLKQRPSTDLIDALKTTNISLGDWSKWLDWVACNDANLDSCKEWMRTITGLRGAIIELIEIRNREVAHKSGLISLESLKKLEENLHCFFDQLYDGLRQTSKLNGFFLPKSRVAVRAGSSIKIYRFLGFDLVSRFDRFQEKTFNLSAKDAESICEGEVIAVRAKTNKILPLNDYFRVVELKPGLSDVFIFEKGFEGGNGLFAGITSGLQRKMPIVADAFTFK